MFSLNEEFAAFAGELADFDLQLNPRLLKILSGMSEQDEDVRHAADAISGLMQKGFEVRPVRQGINWGKLDIKALRNGELNLILIDDNLANFLPAPYGRKTEK
jgi:hypothetical protein